MDYLDFYRDDRLFFTYDCTFPPFAEKYGFHAHEFYEILYLVSGKGNLFVEGHEYDVFSGCIVLFRSNEAHYLTLGGSLEYQRCALHFSPDLLESVDPSRQLLTAFESRKLGQHNVYTPNQMASETIKRAFDNILAVNPASQEKRIAVLANLITVLYEMSRSFREQARRATLDAKSTLVTQVIEYINAHLFDDISLTDLCEKFYISKANLYLIFKKATSATPWNYITIKRLMEAQKMLHKGCKAEEVSTRCGFQEYSSFYRAYKKHFHIAPSQDKGLSLEK